jgi:hypothetical protein
LKALQQTAIYNYFGGKTPALAWNIAGNGGTSKDLADCGAGKTGFGLRYYRWGGDVILDGADEDRRKDRD